MIGKVTRGKSVGGLLRYLFGPGRANEHVDPHLVGSWLGDDGPSLAPLEPVLVDGRHDVAALSARLALPMQLRPDAIDRPVWQCSMRVTDGDRRLTDAEWATVARDVVERTGFAPAGDAGGCRWVAVRHADDHIHIAVVLARQDGGRVDVFRDWPKVHAAARAAEQRLGLQAVASPDRTATIAPTRAEVEKAARTGAHARTATATMPSRAWLTRQVRAAAAGSVSREEFETLLSSSGVAVHWRESQRTPGEVTGYAVGRPGDMDAEGRQVLFGGSRLSPDLSLPRLEARWSEVSGPSVKVGVPRPRRPLSADEREAVLSRAERALRRAAADPSDPAARIAAAEVAAVLAGAVEGPDGGRLTEVAERLSRASRLPGGARPPRQTRTHPLRETATQLALLGHVLPSEWKDALLLLSHVSAIIAAATNHGPSGIELGRLRTPSVPATVPPRTRPNPAMQQKRRTRRR